MTQTDVVPEVVLAERRGAVLLLTLNRPDRLNAWTGAMQDRYADLLAEADADPDVRAVVVTGAGKGFCAGADMAVLGDLTGAAPPQRPGSAALTLRTPLIAAINGAAAGVGLVQALYADVRFATPTAKLTTSFARRGLIAEYGLAWLLPRLVGHSRALDLLLSGRVVTGAEAHAMGLVDHLADDVLPAALGYATDLAENCSPTSMALIKAQVYADAARTLPEALADAEAMMLASFSRPDIAEGVTSWLERRPPRFPPRAG